MSSHEHDNQNQGDLSIAQLLRCAADDELTPEQHERLEAHLAAHPEDRQRIDFERLMRERVSGVMAGDVAPASLRVSVEKALRGEGDAPSTIGGDVTKSRSFWSGGRGLMAMAAIVVIGMTLSIVMRSTLRPHAAPEGWNAYGVQTVSFIEGEHDKCAKRPEYLQRKLTHTEIAEASNWAANHLGSLPASLDISQMGYEFVGLGPCAVPGDGASVHLLYRADENPDQMISVFIQKASNANAYSEDDCYCADEASGGANPSFIWRHDDLVYFVVSPDKLAPKPVRKALEAPGRVVHIS